MLTTEALRHKVKTKKPAPKKVDAGFVFRIKKFLSMS